MNRHQLPPRPKLTGAPELPDLQCVGRWRLEHVRGKTLRREQVAQLFEIIEQQRLSLVWAGRKLRDADVMIASLEREAKQRKEAE